MCRRLCHRQIVAQPRGAAVALASLSVRLEDLDYDLPAERIAQEPLAERSAARLLVDTGDGEPLDRHVRDLPALLEPGDLLVVNESKVIPARLRLRRATGGAVEVVMLEPTGAPHEWTALVRPGRKIRAGERLTLAGGAAVVEMLGRAGDGETFRVRLLGEADDLTLLDDLGEMPLPPYIHTRLAEPGRYQTVYAATPGSAAAPTAGLHFTPTLLAELETMGVGLARVELAVGLDTFQPVAEDDPLRHRIHSERYTVAEDVLERCRAADRVVAVGTTAVRALESAAATGELSGRTSLFIHRGYEWKVVDMLLTNFHMPRTTLLMMIDAFIGPRWRELYAIAIERRYRFLSFGDAMLLRRDM